MEIMGGVILMECDNTLPHKTHSWRERFRKHTCKGVTPEQFDIYMERKWPTPYNPNHKHKMFLSRWWTTGDQMVFICDYSSAGCRENYTISRGLWKRQTIKGYRERMARLAVSPLFRAIDDLIEECDRECLEDD